ncbi:MAG: hypothetical protein ACRD8O_17795 [Bryobacteraceae bacterium]
MSWLANSGPFWDDERYTNPDDLFHFEGDDITDQGLGEAARRKLLFVQANVFSLLDGSQRFARTPLAVQHGLIEQPISTVLIDNFWTIVGIETVAAELRPSSWAQMIDVAKGRLPRLIFSSEILSRLQSSPFHAGVSDRVLELLGVLGSIVAETRDDLSLTDRGIAILQQHFVGEKAWFTDESDGNKRRFRDELTFPDPSVAGRYLVCSWHGKVKIGQFRIHFEWPRPTGQREIKITYIGPKITKH